MEPVEGIIEPSSRVPTALALDRSPAPHISGGIIATGMSPENTTPALIVSVCE